MSSTKVPEQNLPLIKNRYQVQKILGKGGFGRTYLASDLQRFGEPCVLKHFLPANAHAPSLQKSRELFQREAKILHQINHPQVPKFLAFFSHDKHLFIAQEYVEGQTYGKLLRSRLKRQQSFSESEVKVWLRDLLHVLAYIHGLNIIHRDISLENIICPEGRSQPVLIDFGVVKELVSQVYGYQPSSDGDDLAKRASIVGKAGYAPPEQLKLGKCYPCSDLYALGVTAAVLLTGQGAKELMILRAKNQPWHQGINLSPSFLHILDRLLLEVPKDRYQTAPAVLQDLRHCFGEAIPNPSGFLKVPHQEPAASLFDSSNVTGPAVTWPECTPESLSPDFLQRCQTELTQQIGPIASLIFEEALERFPTATPSQLIQALAAEIPDPRKAKAFQQAIEDR